MTRFLLIGIAVLLLAAGSGEVLAQARLANASAHRAVSGMVSACPAAATERGR